MENKKIDIIIPIYNAFDDLKLCLASVEKYSDLKRHRLILVNDNSPDEKIKPLLEDFQAKHSTTVVINNEENKGFSGNVNLGMQQSDQNDVLLLNSDTIVTAGWLDKIIACAYSFDNIGTVTPASNNATLCSVPEFCEENELPPGMSVDEMGELVERVSLKKYPEISVANGFCMFIKREVIELVGLFDEETFIKGYGEENDFCNRMVQLGYKNVMCDDTYIYHSGTKSFLSKEKEERIKAHSRILYKRYPELMRQNEIFCAYNPNIEIWENLKIYMDLQNEKKNILYVLHSDFKEGSDDNVGGTQLHVKDLAMGLKEEYNIFVAARDKNYLNLTVYNDDKKLSFRFLIGDKKIYQVWTDKTLQNIFRNILSAFQIDLVHVHHIQGLSLDIFYEAKRLNIPVYVTMHDFYMMCPVIKLMDHKEEICFARDIGNDCETCLLKQRKIAASNNYINVWRQKMLDALMLTEKIIVPSKNTKSLVSKYYPEMQDKIVPVEHGVADLAESREINYETAVSNELLKSEIEQVLEEKRDIVRIMGSSSLAGLYTEVSDITCRIVKEEGDAAYIPANIIQRTESEGVVYKFEAYIPKSLFKSNETRVEVLIKADNKIIKNNIQHKISIKNTLQEGKLKVAFVGGIDVPKGGKQAYNLMKQSPEDITWYIFGNIGVDELLTLNSKNLFKTGQYKREELSALLSLYQIDVVCILSIWPETYCYTMSEAVLARLPVVVTYIGALGERLHEMSCGWEVPVDSELEKNVLDILNDIKDDKTKLTEKKRTVQNIVLKTIKRMLQDYKELYELTGEPEILYPAFDTYFIYNAFEKAVQKTVGNTVGTNSNEERVRQLESELQRIHESAVHEIAEKILRIKIPFRSQAKAVLRKIVKKN